MTPPGQSVLTASQVEEVTERVHADHGIEVREVEVQRTYAGTGGFEAFFEEIDEALRGLLGPVIE